MRLGTRLLLPARIALAALATLCLGLSAHLVLQQAALRSAGEQTLGAQRLIARVDERSTFLRANVLAYYFDRSASRLGAVREADEEIAGLLTEYARHAAAGDPEASELLAQFMSIREAARRSRAQLLRAIQAQDENAVRLNFDEWGVLGLRADSALAGLVAHGSLGLETALVAAEREQVGALGLGVLALAIIAVLIVAATGLAQGRLEKRLAALAAGIRRLGPDQLDSRLDPALERVDDEIGELARAFAAMAGRVRDSHRSLVAEVSQRGAAEARLAGIIESASDAVVAVDERHEITLFNPAAERMFGRTALEVRGQGLGMLIPERFRGAHAGHIARFAAGEPATRPMGAIGEIWGLKASGEEFPVEASISRTQGRAESLSTVILRDVTQRRKAQDERDRLNAELERRLRERDEAIRELESFSATLSHDLRAPLRAVDGYARLALEEIAAGGSAHLKGHLECARAGARRMGELIDDMLRLARLSRQPLEPRRVDVRAQVADCLSLLGHERCGREVRIGVGSLPAYDADPGLMRQVWMNLLGNALKFTHGRSPAVIEIGAYAARQDATVYFVRDNGAGFDMRHAHRLFREFQRLHSQSEYPGTGIGLAIAERIVRRHGGRIWAQAAPGSGAAFHFTLDSGDFDDAGRAA